MISFRRELSLVEKKSYDAAILEKTIQRDEWKKATSVCVYASLSEEVDTFNLIKSLFDTKKCVVVPRVRENCEIELFQITSFDDLSLGTFGVLEPMKQCKRIDTSSVELFIVPGLAFDRKGNRLGWGKGYYDHLLESVTVPKIALSYSFQVEDEIPYDTHDIRMTTIITEKEVIDTFD
jgi:5-formyltetrahydrofolate cyclo-ligase